MGINESGKRPKGNQGASEQAPRRHDSVSAAKPPGMGKPNPSSVPTQSLIAVLTAPRPGKEYLTTTIKAIEAEGALEHPYRAIFSDGPLEHDWPVFPGSKRVGCLRMLWRIFEAANFVDSDLIYLQDDIQPCKNAIRAALALDCKDLPFISMFQVDTVVPSVRGITRVPLAGPLFRHSQALKIPNKTIRKILRHTRIYGMPQIPIRDGQGDDYALGSVLYDIGYREYGTMVPCWFNHIGEVSAVNSDGKTVVKPSPYWRGVRYDALKWNG